MPKLKDNEVLSMDGFRPLSPLQHKALIDLLIEYRKINGSKTKVGQFTKAFLKDWGNGIIRNFLIFEAILEGEVAFDVLPDTAGFQFIMTKTRDNLTEEQLKGVDKIVGAMKEGIKELTDDK
jgi:hypothetical protein